MTARLFLLLAASLLGCSTHTGTPEPSRQPPAAVSEEDRTPTQSATTEEFTHVITTDTAYYTIGPQQARPPDGTLKAGTKVRVVREAGSYCQVETEDGVVGFVAVDAVEEAREEKD
jgi:hypothetical protein